MRLNSVQMPTLRHRPRGVDGFRPQQLAGRFMVFDGQVGRPRHRGETGSVRAVCALRIRRSDHPAEVPGSRSRAAHLGGRGVRLPAGRLCEALARNRERASFPPRASRTGATRSRLFARIRHILSVSGPQVGASPFRATVTERRGEGDESGASFLVNHSDRERQRPRRSDKMVPGTRGAALPESPYVAHGRRPSARTTGARFRSSPD
jgi:hypothetical protein